MLPLNQAALGDAPLVDPLGQHKRAPNGTEDNNRNAGAVGREGAPRWANIEKPAHLEGKSMVNLVKQTETRKAAFLSYDPENTAMQTERYHYILYADGSEELYDHDKDPHEWTNLSNHPELATMKAEMKRAIKDFLSQ